MVLPQTARDSDQTTRVLNRQQSILQTLGIQITPEVDATLRAALTQQTDYVAGLRAVAGAQAIRDYFRTNPVARVEFSQMSAGRAFEEYTHPPTGSTLGDQERAYLLRQRLATIANDLADLRAALQNAPQGGEPAEHAGVRTKLITDINRAQQAFTRAANHILQSEINDAGVAIGTATISTLPEVSRTFAEHHTQLSNFGPNSLN